MSWREEGARTGSVGRCPQSQGAEVLIPPCSGERFGQYRLVSSLLQRGGWKMNVEVTDNPFDSECTPSAGRVDVPTLSPTR